MIRLLPVLLFLVATATSAQTTTSLPYRGLAIAAPDAANVDRFIRFIDTELAPRQVNLLVLRVDYGFQYESHAELREDNALSTAQVKRLVRSAQKHNIRLVPQINLLGHQSWHSSVGKLLEVYPQFDETPHVTLPAQYVWPNEDGLYCKSYCPLHPGVHEVVFALIDEITAAFEADAFHAGMDEVFYIGDDRCPRCAGKDKAELFAAEVTRIHDHLAASGRELWIWGDRLIDGDASGLGMWEASTNGTHPAIDLIPKDVVITDWHYERAEPTPAYFAIKGFRVLASAWNRADVALAQRDQAQQFRASANPTLADRHLGTLHTYWAGADQFLDLFVDGDGATAEEIAAIEAFRTLYPRIAEPVAN